MNRHVWIILSLISLCWTGRPATELPPFAEVYQLIRSNVAGLTEADLNRMAVEGLLKELHPRVMLDSGPGPGGETRKTEALASPRIFERTLGYLRVNTVEPGLAAAMASALAGLAGTGRVDGVVLDLRFALGTDYAEAGRVADCFVNGDRPLVVSGEVTIRSTVKTNAWLQPVAILVNSETTGAAEALAAALRSAEVGLLLGSATAGNASLYREFPLANGQRLSIASIPVRVGDGQELPSTGVKPDIEVAVKPGEERAYFADPYRVPPRSASALRRGATNAVTGATNRASRISEADLVRMKREGMSLDDDAARPAPIPASPEAPLVTDPVLGRALDLLKGLAVLKSHR